MDGISQKVLTDILRSMEEDGLITRTVYAEVPPRVEYALSDLGQSLKPIFDSMVAWGTAYKENTSPFASTTMDSPENSVNCTSGTTLFYGSYSPDAASLPTGDLISDIQNY